ncbi:MAG: hypothetical protein AAFR55_07935, partial [Pseudomonadota bacterium]
GHVHASVGEACLAWPAWLCAQRAHDGLADRPTHMRIATTADKLARTVAWAAATMDAPALDFYTHALPQAMLGHPTTTTGVDAVRTRRGAADTAEAVPRLAHPPALCLLEPAITGHAAGGAAAAMRGLSHDADPAAHAAHWTDRLAANAVAEGRLVRRLSVDLSDPGAYGALAATVWLDRLVISAAVASARDASAARFC